MQRSKSRRSEERSTKYMYMVPRLYNSLQLPDSQLAPPSNLKSVTFLFYRCFLNVSVFFWILFSHHFSTCHFSGAEPSWPSAPADRRRCLPADPGSPRGGTCRLGRPGGTWGTDLWDVLFYDCAMCAMRGMVLYSYDLLWFGILTYLSLAVLWSFPSQV